MTLANRFVKIYIHIVKICGTLLFIKKLYFNIFHADKKDK